MRHAVGLILAVASLIICTASFSAPSGLASAQASAPSWGFTGSLNSARSGHTTTLLPNGKVLVVGGGNTAGALDSAELYDPVAGTWRLTGGPNVSRSYHTATLLLNGKVLIAGGFPRAELYDPVAGTWSFTGNLNRVSYVHGATLLSDGKVLVTGGILNGSPFSHAELYDPGTETWSVAGNFNRARWGYTQTQLANGKILVAGGTEGEFWGETLNSCELYDPSTGTWSLTGDLNVGRLSHTATLLTNGNVLVTGGESPDFGVINQSAELYNPATGKWSYTASLSTRREFHTATLLPNGQVLVAGGQFVVLTGNIDPPLFFSYLDSAEIYDPASGNWSATVSLNGIRFGHAAVLLQSGKVLVVGGWNGTNGGSLGSAELYGSGVISSPNPLDDPQLFVRQQYLDFLNREPDSPGLAHWAGEITACNDPSRRQPGESLALCTDRRRTNTSAAFFLSPEFQYTGYFVYRLYKGSLLQNGAGRFPSYQEFLRDFGQVRNGIIQNNQLSAAAIEQNKKTFAEEFTRRAEFRSLSDPLSNFDYVERLFQTTGISVSPTEKQELVNGLNNQTETRASVLQKVVDGTVVIAEGNQQFTTPYGRAFYEKEFNAAFVLMEYFGYLRRDPDAAGYQHWLDKLNLYGNYQDAEMVKSFITSPEYRARFGQP